MDVSGFTFRAIFAGMMGDMDDVQRGPRRSGEIMRRVERDVRRPIEVGRDKHSS